MRITWKIDPTTSEQGREDLLGEVTRHDLLRPPVPVHPGSPFYCVVPNGEAEALRLLAALRKRSDVVREPMLEVGFSTPLSPLKAIHGLVYPLIEMGVQDETSDLRQYQAYLGSAPQGGIDAHYAWRRPGGRGQGITIVDLEWGCLTHHEDLLKPLEKVEIDEDPHGTMVLGLLCADPTNGIGIDGIANGATSTIEKVSVKATDQVTDYVEIESVLQGLRGRLKKGDVVLIELQAEFRPPEGEKSIANLPVEFSTVIREAIEDVCRDGIYVVEAAGNGGKDLAEFGLDETRRSPAILVGAAEARTRQRLEFSNHGSRVDLQGWGELVVTTGDGSLVFHPDRARCYSQTFSGTSSAAAMVAGAVACISGFVKAHGIKTLSPRAMRDLLVTTGSPQTGPDKESAPIGPLPNLRRAIKKLEKTHPVEIKATKAKLALEKGAKKLKSKLQSV